MKQHLIKTLRWFSMGLMVVLVGPYVLGKLGFYAPSHADSPVSKASSSGLVPSTSPNTQAQHHVFSYAEAVKSASPAVVSIKTTLSHWNGNASLHAGPIM